VSLTSDVNDVVEAVGSAGQLFMLNGRMSTVTGQKLVSTLYTALEAHMRRLAAAETECRALRAEVDGLRSQNEQLTEIVESVVSKK
jgi:hypothetical protein